jgi:hypothetical protein
MRIPTVAFISAVLGLCLLQSSAPTEAATGVQQISAGADTTCAVVNGGLSCWGYLLPPPGAIVTGFESGVTQVDTRGGTTCAIKDGGLWCWGTGGSGQLGNGMSTDSVSPVAVVGMGSGVSKVTVGGQAADAWPPDVNNDTFVDTGDIGALTNHFGDAVPADAPARYNIAPDPPDGFIDTGDIARLTNLFSQTCMPL